MGRPAKYCGRSCFERNSARMERKRIFSKEWSNKRKAKWEADHPEQVAAKKAKKEEIARMKAEAVLAVATVKPRVCKDCEKPMHHTSANAIRCAECNKVHVKAYRKARYEANKSAYKLANLKYMARRAANGGRPLSQHASSA